MQDLDRKLGQKCKPAALACLVTLKIDFGGRSETWMRGRSNKLSGPRTTSRYAGPVSVNPEICLGPMYTINYYPLRYGSLVPLMSDDEACRERLKQARRLGVSEAPLEPGR